MKAETARRAPEPVHGFHRRAGVLAGLLALIGAGTFVNPEGGKGRAEGNRGKFPKAVAHRRRRNRIALESRTLNSMKRRGKR